MDMGNSVGIHCGSEGWDGRRRAKGGNWDEYNRITIKNDLIIQKTIPGKTVQTRNKKQEKTQLLWKVTS